MTREEDVLGADTPDTLEVYRAIQAAYRDARPTPRQVSPPWSNPGTYNDILSAYGQPTQDPPGSTYEAFAPTYIDSEQRAQAVQRKAPLETVARDSFWDRTWEFAWEFAKETAESFNPFQGGISRRERLFRAANVGSLFLPVGWMAEAGRLGAVMPAARAWAMTAKGRVAMHALEGAVVAGGLEAIRDPEDRGEHGVLTAALSGGVIGGAVGGLTDKLLYRANRARTTKLMQRIVDPEDTARALLDTDEHWAIIPHDRADLRAQGSGILPEVVVGNAKRLETHLGETGYASVPVKLRDGTSAHLVAGIDPRQAAAVASELGIDQVITSRGLVHAEQRWISPLDRKGSRIGPAIDEAADWVAIPVAREGSDPMRVAFKFDMGDARRLGSDYAQVRLKAREKPGLWEVTESKIDRAGSSRMGGLWQRFSDLDTRNVAGHWYSQLINRLHGAKALDEMMHEGKRWSDLGVGESLAKVLQIEKTGWASRAEAAIRYAVRDENGMVKVLDTDEQGPISSLFDILHRLTPDEMEAFERYGTARVWDSVRKKGGRLAPDIERALADGQAELEAAPAHFKTAFNRIVKWRNQWAYDTLVRNNVISEGEWRAFTTSNLDALPVFHSTNIEDVVGELERTKASFDPVSWLATEADHSGVTYTPWLEELVRETHMRSRLAGQQRAYNRLGEYVDEAGPWLEVAGKVKQVLAPADPRNLGGKPLIRTTTVDPSGEVVPRWLEVTDRDLWDSMASLAPTQLSTVTRIASIPAALQRAGVTAAPEFVTKNPIRDIAFAWVNAGVSPLAFAQGVASVLGRDDFYQLWLHSGGAGSALSSMDRAAMRANINEAASRSLMTRGVEGAVDVVKHPIQNAIALSEHIENMTRVGVFRRYLGKVGALDSGIGRMEGAEQWAAEHLLGAAYESRNATVDFSVAGASALMKNMRPLAAFFGSALSSADALAASVKRDPVGFTARAATAITLPSLALYAINRRDPDYMEAIPDWEKNLFWHIKRSSLPGPLAAALGEDPGPQDDLWLRFPKPFEPGMAAGSLVERMLEAIDNEDPTLLDDGMDQMLGEWADSFVPMPTVLAPILELARNKSGFTGDPIIPSSLEDVEPRYQRTAGTTEFAKGLAASLNHGLPSGDPGEISPIAIDHVMRSWTGGLGRFLYGDLGDLAVSGYRAVAPRDPNALDTYRGEIEAPATEHLERNPLTRGFVSRFPYASQATDDFYAIADRVRRSGSTLQYLEDSFRLDDYVDQLTRRAVLVGATGMVESTQKEIQALRKSKQMVLMAPGMSAEDKRASIRALDDAMNQQAVAILSALRSVDVHATGYPVP